MNLCDKLLTIRVQYCLLYTAYSVHMRVLILHSEPSWECLKKQFLNCKMNDLNFGTILEDALKLSQDHLQ